MSVLPDVRHRLSSFRVISGALSVAFVLALLEVFLLAPSLEPRLDISQLTLAAFSNVAAIGFATLALVFGGWFVAWAITLPLKSQKVRVRTCLITGLPAVGTAWLVDAGHVFGYADRFPYEWVNPAVAVVIGSLAGLGIWRFGVTTKPSLMNLTRGVVIIAWLGCVSAAGVGTWRTLQYVIEWTEAGPNEAKSPSSTNDHPNLFLVVLDTLRADKVGVYGESNLTPNIDRLAETSIVYENAISTAPWTLPTHASYLTGLYPDQSGINWGNYKLGEDIPILPDLLKADDYESFAISNNHLLNEANGFSRGFDDFIETTLNPCLSHWKLALRCGTLQALAPLFGLSRDAGWDQGSAWTNWLLRKRLAGRPAQARPLFVMLNYFEPHDPYVPPRRFRDRLLSNDEIAEAVRLKHGEVELAAHACGHQDVFSKSEIGLLEKLYEGDVAYQDEIVGELVDILRNNGLLDNSWLFVTSDHGELFGEWDMVYHTASSHYQLLHEPLVVRPPGGTPMMRRISAPVQPVDLFATMLARADVPLPDNVHRAYELPMNESDTPERTVCVAQTHGASIAGLSITQRLSLQTDVSHWLRWVTSIYQDGYLLELDSAGSERLFNVGEDPQMLVDLTDAHHEIIESMRDGLEAWVSANPQETETEGVYGYKTKPANSSGNRNHRVARAGD